MTRHLLFLLTAVIITACNDVKQEKAAKNNTRVLLRPDSLNIVKLSDTLRIDENICRGCAYEGSVRFDISDSLGVVKLLRVLTQDDSPPGMAGGSVGKELLLVPVKPGSTSIRLYKFLSPETAKEDSGRYKTYTIEVKN